MDGLTRDGRLDVIDRQIEEICKEVVRRHSLTKGGQIRFEDKDTGEKVLVKGITEYDVLEAKYKAECEENTRLLQQVAQQKSENEVLHRKVNDLDHKLSQACQERDKLSQACKERDKLTEKLLRAGVEAQKYDLLLKKLSHLIYEETRC